MHCLRGKIPCEVVLLDAIVKFKKWSLTSVFDEYERFVGSLRSYSIPNVLRFTLLHPRRVQKSSFEKVRRSIYYYNTRTSVRARKGMNQPSPRVLNTPSNSVVRFSPFTLLDSSPLKFHSNIFIIVIKW